MKNVKLKDSDGEVLFSRDVKSGSYADAVSMAFASYLRRFGGQELRNDACVAVMSVEVSTVAQGDAHQYAGAAPFKEGEKAFNDGAPIMSCPYEFNAADYAVRKARRQWRAGWKDADARLAHGE